MERARQIAEKRSGERGLAARQELVAAEARLAEAREGLGAPIGAEELAAAAQAAQVHINWGKGGAWLAAGDGLKAVLWHHVNCSCKVKSRR